MIEYSSHNNRIKKSIKKDGDVLQSVYPVSYIHHLRVTTANQEITNDGSDTETVNVAVVDGLEVMRGTDPTNATVLDYNGDVTLSVDGQQTTKTLTNGSVSFDLTTDKPAGSEIEIVAESLADHVAESDSATIEVVSP